MSQKPVNAPTGAALKGLNNPAPIMPPPIDEIVAMQIPPSALSGHEPASSIKNAPASTRAALRN